MFVNIEKFLPRTQAIKLPFVFYVTSTRRPLAMPSSGRCTLVSNSPLWNRQSRRRFNGSTKTMNRPGNNRSSFVLKIKQKTKSNGNKPVLPTNDIQSKYFLHIYKVILIFFWQMYWLKSFASLYQGPKWIRLYEQPGFSFFLRYQKKMLHSYWLRTVSIYFMSVSISAFTSSNYLTW